jgi:hypothetical protein
MTTVTLKGPFTPADIDTIVRAMETVNARQPLKHFSYHITDHPTADEISSPTLDSYRERSSEWTRCRCGHTVAEHETDECKCACG